MFAIRLLAIPALVLVLAAPAPAVFNALVRNIPKPGPHSHAAHLVQAERDLLAAESAIAARNPALAHRAVTAAIHQVNQATTHHHSNVIATFPAGNGLTGLIVRTQHHHHHGLLHQALTHLHAAQKSLKANNATASVQHIEFSGKAIQVALANHHHFIGR